MIDTPLSHAAHRAAMATLRRYPDRNSTFGEVTPAVTLSARVHLDVRLGFDDATRIAGTVLRRRVLQAETLELLLTYALSDDARFLAFLESVRVRASA